MWSAYVLVAQKSEISRGSGSKSDPNILPVSVLQLVTGVKQPRTSVEGTPLYFVVGQVRLMIRSTVCPPVTHATVTQSVSPNFCAFLLCTKEDHRTQKLLVVPCACGTHFHSMKVIFWTSVLEHMMNLPQAKILRTCSGFIWWKNGLVLPDGWQMCLQHMLRHSRRASLKRPLKTWRP